MRTYLKLLYRQSLQLLNERGIPEPAMSVSHLLAHSFNVHAKYASNTANTTNNLIRLNPTTTFTTILDGEGAPFSNSHWIYDSSSNTGSSNISISNNNSSISSSKDLGKDDSLLGLIDGGLERENDQELFLPMWFTTFQ